jgi:hypothetical protein
MSKKMEKEEIADNETVITFDGRSSKAPIQ